MHKKPSTSSLIFLIILLAVSGCILALNKLNTQFDASYWINFTNSILTNLIVVGFALLVIEKILERGKTSKFKDINAKKSEHIVFLIERLEFKLLVFLKIINKKKYFAETSQNDKELFHDIDAKFINNLQNENLLNTFWEKIEKSKNRNRVFTDFIKIVKEDGSNIAKSLKEIYPQPKPEILEVFEGDIPKLAGMIEAAKSMSDINKQAQKYANTKSLKITESQQTTLTKVSYYVAQPYILNVFRNISNSRETAKENKLFLNL
jgi:hypothetical protein